MIGRKHMIPGKAVVVSTSFDESPWRSSDGATSLMDYILDVTPSEGEPFRAQIKASILEPSPHSGDELKVMCDPVKKKVKFDLKGDPRFDAKLLTAQKKAEHEAILAAPSGTAIADIAGPGQEAARAAAEIKADLLARGFKVAKGPSAPRWILPTECPNCGAKIEQATKSLEENPHCNFCEQPLPVQLGT